MLSINDELKRLEKDKKDLLEEMNELETKKSKNEILEVDYEIEKKLIERKIVEVMDRLVQYRYLKGNS